MLNNSLIENDVSRATRACTSTDGGGQITVEVPKIRNRSGSVFSGSDGFTLAQAHWLGDESNHASGAGVSGITHYAWRLGNANLEQD